MAINGRVHPECVNAGNPYHECGVVCLEKISQGITRKPKSKNKSDPRKGVVKQDQHVRKAGGGETRSAANPNCPKAANPFHECGRTCTFNKPAEVTNNLEDPEDEDAGSFILGAPVSKIREEIKALSNPNSPQGINNAKPAYLGVVASPRSPLSNTNSHKKSVDSESSRSSNSCLQQLDESGSRVQSRESVPAPGMIMEVNNTAASSPKLPASSDNTSNVPLPKTVELNEETQSLTSDSSVLVGKYHVKSSVAPILSSILLNHGDIAENCNFQSSSMLSHTLECLCYLVQDLQSVVSTKLLSRSKLKELLAVLKDVESAGIDMKWIRGVEYDLAVELVKRELESLVEDLAAKEKAVAEAKAKVEGIRVELAKLEGNSLRLKEGVLGSWPLVERFHHGSKSLGDGIL